MCFLLLHLVPILRVRYPGVLLMSHRVYVSVIEVFVDPAAQCTSACIPPMYDSLLEEKVIDFAILAMISSTLNFRSDP